MHQYELKPAGLTKQHLDRALSMSRKSDSGLLTKTEGTYPFWSPEMCQCTQHAFSGYGAGKGRVENRVCFYCIPLIVRLASLDNNWFLVRAKTEIHCLFFDSLPQDIWAAGICLYIFVSGRLPFFSDAPLDLMEAIAEGEVPFDSLDVSDACLSLLKMTLAKDPSQRAGVGDCLQHPFLKDARAQRISQLSDEFRMSHREIIIGEEDLRAVSYLRKFSVVSELEFCRFANIFLGSLPRRFKLSREFPVFLSKVPRSMLRLPGSGWHDLLKPPLLVFTRTSLRPALVQ